MNIDPTVEYTYHGGKIKLKKHSMTFPQNFQNGWVLINREGITYLKLNNTGHLILDGFSLSPIKIERK